MSAAAWSSVFAGGAFVAAVLFGVLNLRRAARGPKGTPAFHAYPWASNASGRLVLEHVGTADACDARITFPGDQPSVLDGKLEWARLSKGQKVTLIPVWGWGSSDLRVRVDWTPAHRGDPGYWESDVVL